MRKLFNIIIVLLFLTIAELASFAQQGPNGEIFLHEIRQTPEPVYLSLEQCLSIAMEMNYDLKIITAQKNQSKWQYRNSLTSFLPDITYNLNGDIQNGDFSNSVFGTSVTGPFKSLSSNLEAGWDVFTGLRRYYNAKAAKYKYDANKQTLFFTKQQVMLNTTTAYYSLLQNKLNIQILIKQLQQTQSQLQIAQQRYEAGLGTKFDVLRAQTEVASSNQRLISAQNNYILAQATLSNTLGINIFTDIRPAEERPVPKTLIDESLTLQNATSIALVNRPDLDASRLNVLANRATKNSVLTNYLPSVRLRAGLSAQKDELSQLDFTTGNNVGFTVSWIGGTGMGLNTYTLFKAQEEQMKQAKYQYEHDQRNAEQSLVNSFYNSITSRELISVAKEQAQDAQESLRLSLVRFKAGVGIYTDVIQAQLIATQSLISYLNAVIDYNISQAQLLFDMGVISPNNLILGYTIKVPKSLTDEDPASEFIGGYSGDEKKNSSSGKKQIPAKK